MEPVGGSLSPLPLTGDAAAPVLTEPVFPHFSYHKGLYVSLASLLRFPCSDLCILFLSLRGQQSDVEEGGFPDSVEF